MANKKDIGTCLTCKHIKWVGGLPSACSAFPKGIPLEIQLNQVNHDVPFKGDNGIQYERKKFPRKNKVFDDPILR